jgi:hypothetical protein
VKGRKVCCSARNLSFPWVRGPLLEAFFSLIFDRFLPF